MWNEITVIDNALTGPWLVKKRYERTDNPRHNWIEEVCADDNLHVRIGTENYMISADGFLMPVRKGQPPPDLRYFKQTGR